MSARRTRFGMAVLAGAALILVVALSSSGVATHTPANKVWADGAEKEFMTDSLVDEDQQEVEILRARAKYNNTTDLRLSVTGECALWTNTATLGDDDSEAKARVEVYVTIDGKPVPVSPSDVGEPDPLTTDPDVQGGPGRVVFCNRAARMKTEQIETVPEHEQCIANPFPPPAEICGTVPESDDSDTEDDILIRSYNRSRTANAFNWGAMNVGVIYDDAVIKNGKGQVLIQVFARLAHEVIDHQNEPGNNAPESEDADSPAAMAAVGKRTLFAEPVKMANDASL